MNKSFIWFYLLLLFVFADSFAQSPAKYEMRGVWIAVVKNIDWPSSAYISPEEQKKEMLSILDRLKKNNINAIFFQVRTECDAVYFSDIEPFTEWAKKGDYDPLAFIIEEAHKRGMEVHAWFNPFRSVFNIDDGVLQENHISKTHPEWNITYGKQKWLNPGLPEVRNYILSVVEDVLKRYNIDGIHFDDYFYPYPQKKIKFNDDAAYNKYALISESRDEWRRGNINSLIKAVHYRVKEIKPNVRFGVSPFGIWKNKRSDIEGSNTFGSESYETVYADSKLWLKEGWVDYLAPQIYWNMNNSAASYKELIKWWNDNSFGHDIYAGMAVYRIGSNDKLNPEWNNITHFLDEIKLNRSLANIKGSIFFNTSSFLKNPLGFSDSLISDYFAEYVPATGSQVLSIAASSVMKKINRAEFNVIRSGTGIYKIYLAVREPGIMNLSVLGTDGKILKVIYEGLKESGFYELNFSSEGYKGNCFFRLKSGGYINTYKIRI